MGSKWREIQLSEFVSHQKGFAFKSKDYIDSGVPVVRVSNFTDDSIDISDFKYVSQSIANDKLSYELFEDDVIVATVGSWPTNPASVVGKVVRVPSAATPSLLNQNAVILRPITDEKLDKVFLFYLLKDKSFSEYIVSTAQGSANQASITLKDIYAYRFILPNKKGRKKIAKILNRLDNKITLNRQINQTLEQMAQALFKSWFVDFDPVIDNALDAGFFEQNSDLPEELLRRAEQRKIVREQPNFKPLPAETRQLFPAAFEECEEPLLGLGGWVPKGWGAVTIKSLCVKTQNGGTPKRANSEYWDDGDIPWLTSGEVRQSIITHVENRITKIGLDNSSAKWIPVYSTLVALYGATAGEVSINALSLTSNQAVCALIPKDGYCWFNYLFVKSKTKLMQNNAVGSAQQNISKRLVEDLVVLSPTFNVATYFNSLVSDFFIKNISNSKQIQSLSNLRDTLLPKLISGELRLSDDGTLASGNTDC